MNNIKLLYFAVLIAVVVLLFYMVHFFGESFSNNSSDWGAFGSYMGIGLSAISITLIYITYDEQRNSNKIARFEQRFFTMTKTLEELSERNKEELDSKYQTFNKHFLFNSGILGYDRKIVAKVLNNYYSLAFIDVTKDYTHLFRYLAICVTFIRSATFLTDEEKGNRIIELACIIPESIRIFYLCWQLSNEKKPHKWDYEYGLFLLDDSAPELLRDVIKYYFTGKIEQNMEIVTDDCSISLDDYSDELFCDTYNRFIINKKN